MNKVNNDPTTRILNYMIEKNRPYCANDVQRNLHNDYSKAVVTKVLSELTASSKLIEKVYGKQKVYCVNQHNLPQDDEGGEGPNQEDYEALKSKLEELKKFTQELEKEVNLLESSLSTEDLRTSIESMKEECSTMSDKLETLRGNTCLVDKDEKNKLVNEKAKFVKLWKERKKLCNEIIDCISENCPDINSKKQFKEDIGIEEDDS